nr:PREDICTED: protocadherin-10-like [Latimeria chalumnae]|eukprot:XP_014350992.1 PREDICTED: protocadherin-10-like [Latimeria chalumnae]
MLTRRQRNCRTLGWEYLWLLSFSFFWNSGFAQVRYSVSEELGQDAFVGNIAEDLGLEVNELSARRFRIVSAAQKNYVQVNLENGILFVNERIDREQLCLQKLKCVLNVEFVIENPFEIYYAEIEILDINDNSPIFSKQDIQLSIVESSAVGARFRLESAQDLDTGSNSLATFTLSANEKFTLEIEYRGGRSKIPILVLEMPLDREQQPIYHLSLTALDGGLPERSGTLQITVTVADSNDNAPVFDQETYFVNLLENSIRGSVVVKLSAVDKDDGSNGKIQYSFSRDTSDAVTKIFSIDRNTGEINVEGLVDFEESNRYEFEIEAQDGAQIPMISHCNVVVKVIDVNDNTPVLSVNSLSTLIEEDTPLESVIALISITDRDSDESGRTKCELPGTVPFKLKSTLKANLYSLVTKDLLDREGTSKYNITILGSDFGSPPLSASTVISVNILDINDNEPRFAQSSYTIYVMENNHAGAPIFSVSAFDPDWNENALVTYSIPENDKDSSISGTVSINTENGSIFAYCSFDFEQMKYFSFEVEARDSGIPSLTSTTTVNVFILDQNDNAPKILSPVPKTGFAVVQETISRSMASGYLVTKIRAYDADIGYNALLSFQMIKSTDPNLFSIGLYSGEVRTLRPLVDINSSTLMLEILVKDNGEKPLSTTLTLAISISDGAEDIIPSKVLLFNEESPHAENISDITVNLIITLGSFSFLFLISIVLLISIQCCKTKHNRLNQVFLPYTSHGELNVNGSQYHSYRYKMYLSQESAKNELILIKPLNPTKSTNMRTSGEHSFFTDENGTCVSSMWKSTTPTCGGIETFQHEKVEFSSSSFNSCKF